MGFSFLFVALFLTSTGYYVVAGNDPIISVAPVDTVGCYGGISIFYCGSERSDVNHIGWAIIVDGNTYDITDEVAELRGINITTNGVGNSSLSTIGSEDNNGIGIQCTVVTSGTPYLDSLTALFTVSDIPPVTNLTITFTNNGTIMNCTWIQPSCLPVNYWYSISINNVTVTNTTNTVYSINDIEPCTNYTVGVTVKNESMPIIKTVTSGLYKGLVVFDKCVYFIDNLCFIKLKLQKPTSTYFNKVINACQVYSSLKILNSGAILPTEHSESEKGTSILVDNDLGYYDDTNGITIGPFNESFRGYYSLQTTQGKEVSNTKISTFHVQNAVILQLPNGTTFMQCEFALNSSADGCQFEISHLQAGIEKISIKKDLEPDGKTATIYADLNIPIGYHSYDVLVYDIVNREITTMAAFSINYYHHLQHSQPQHDNNSITAVTQNYTVSSLTIILGAVGIVELVVLIATCGVLICILRLYRNQKKGQATHPSPRKAITSQISKL